jgi:hypothetical protein
MVDTIRRQTDEDKMDNRRDVISLVVGGLPRACGYSRRTYSNA